MNLGDMPTMNTLNYAHSTYQGVAGRGLQAASAVARTWSGDETRDHWAKKVEVHQQLSALAQTLTEEKGQKVATKPTRRLIRLLVVDPHPSVPLDQCVLYQSDEKMTDLSDQDLFYEIASELMPKLKAHNEKRVTWNERAKADNEKAVKLEPARISDLTMTTVVIASF